MGFRGSAARVRALAALALLLLPTACLLPLRRAPAISGSVVDAETGRPVADAVVVVRFDAWYDDSLPDRGLLAHAEAVTDALGRFRVGPVTRAGFAAWPLWKTQARVVGVIADGYRCADPKAVPKAAEISPHVRLERALDAQDRRESCRPVPARDGEAQAYMSAWRALFPERVTRSRGDARRKERVLAARAAFGFGENCEGPVVDLALAPGGRRVALVVARGDAAEIEVLDLSEGRREVVSRTRPSPHQRLAWTRPGELVLWEPATQERRRLSASIFGNAGFEVVWKAPPGDAVPAAIAPGGSGPARPLDPADLNDEGDARWRGRSFLLRREIHGKTGLARDRLQVTRPDASRYAIELPGETCGPRGRFGRPHYRIDADGRSALDLRFVKGGCHALRIDLASGAWTRLDRGRAPARCRDARSVGASHFATALRSYAHHVGQALALAGGDPSSAYTLVIAPDGRTRARSRDLMGDVHTAEVPPFPLATPLRRIDVTVIGWTPERPPAPPASPSPL